MLRASFKLHAIIYITGGENMNYNYYKRLKDMRESYDLSQDDFAKILGTTRQQIGRWENGIQKMGIDKYIKLAQYFNISIDYLTGLIDTPRKLK